MNQSQTAAKKPGFGRRKEAPVLTLHSNGRVRKMTIKPLTFALIGSAFAMFIVGYFAATAYLILRDDLIGASIARNARMQHTYEDRIAALRSQIDRITSRQLIEQRAMQQQIERLVARQKALGARQGQLSSVLGQSAKYVPTPKVGPTPGKKPDATIKTGAVQPTRAQTGLRLGSLRSNEDGQNEGGSPVVVAYASSKPQHPAFSQIENALNVVEDQQISDLKNVRHETSRKAQKIASALKKLGVRAPTAKAVGGPEVSLKGSDRFTEELQALDAAVAHYDAVKRWSRTVPIGSPVPGMRMTSRFGSRIDPFTRRPAMHTGLDFKARSGHPVRSTADGLVKSAKRKGGYGKMIEIVHANGLTTHYAHLKRYHVKAGQRVKAGQIIGRVGSTGRSTGPHLHYEVRRNGQAMNPARYVGVKRRIASAL
ncbi:MAG: M23 family metallopeptidase [Pseudomonadota bacterium]